MKLVKRISLFMVMSAVMLGLGGWGALKAEEFFYPHRYSHGIAQSGTEEADHFRPLVSQSSGVADADYAAPSEGVQVGKVTAEQVIETEEKQVIEAAAAQEPVVTPATWWPGPGDGDGERGDNSRYVHRSEQGRAFGGVIRL